ncbi:Protein kinase domain-containing protein [Trichostrongylus colubriformis]|uniref:Protein kinase domain-containing protein n=1 Tax=Trichostrongylus colubriformis TaxID=6319 RepID=A0AAN8F082_TRICO
MAKCSAENAKRTMSDMKDVSTEYPDDIRLLNFGEQIVTDTNEKFSIMDALVMASHGMLMRVEKCDDGKLLCAKIQANKITRKQYPGDFNKEIRALELMKMKKVENKFLPRLWGKGKTEDLTFYITDHVGQTLQRQLRRYKIGTTSAFRICRYIIEAMKTIHELGLVHGNIRPSSILVGAPHERNVVRLFGFQFSTEHPKKPNDTEQIGYPLDRYTPRAVHKGERVKPKHDLEMYIYLMYELTIGLPWRNANSLKELVSGKDTFWKKYFEQNWGRIPAIIRDKGFDIDKEKEIKIEYIAIEHELDDLLQMLPPAPCFEWEGAQALATQPQRKGPTLITPLDIGVTKGQSRTVVERCEAVLQPDL